MQHIIIHTDHDITNTGVVRNFKKELLPIKINREIINTKEQWIKCRRQQSNWETIIQTISLRTQPMNIRTTKNDNVWTLEFDVEFNDVYRKNGDSIGLLKEDFKNLPMITGLDESEKMENFLIIDKNIRFETYEI